MHTKHCPCGKIWHGYKRRCTCGITLACVGAQFVQPIPLTPKKLLAHREREIARLEAALAVFGVAV